MGLVNCRDARRESESGGVIIGVTGIEEVLIAGFDVVRGKLGGAEDRTPELEGSRRGDPIDK